MDVSMRSVHDEFQSLDTQAVENKLQQVCRVLKRDDGFWVYHKNKVDVATTFSNPEEKLWLVVKDYQGGIKNFNKAEKASQQETMPERGIKLQKNAVIKLGRVRLRVCDIDNEQQPKKSNSQAVNHEQIMLEEQAT